MRQNQKRLCCDVTVLRSAECWTDHKLLRARLQLKTLTRPAKSKTRKRYDVAALGDENVRNKYNECVREAIVGKWKKEENAVRKWEMRDAMVSAVESVLPFVSGLRFSPIMCILPPTSTLSSHPHSSHLSDAAKTCACAASCLITNNCLGRLFNANGCCG